MALFVQVKCRYTDTRKKETRQYQGADVIVDELDNITGVKSEMRQRGERVRR